MVPYTTRIILGQKDGKNDLKIWLGLPPKLRKEPEKYKDDQSIYNPGIRKLCKEALKYKKKKIVPYKPVIYNLGDENGLSYDAGFSKSDNIEFVKFLKEKNIPFLIATSNSRFSPEEIAKRMGSKGFLISEKDIISPLSIAPEYMKEKGIKSVFVIGSENLKDYMKNKGFLIKDDFTVDCVLVGMDKDLNFKKLKIATTAIKRKNAKLFGLNGNLISQDDDGLLFPGVGSITKMLSEACNVDFIHFGKMSDIYNRIAFKKLGFPPENIGMISDDIYIDLMGYSSLGLKTIFATTGKYSKKDIPENFKPDYIIDSLKELIGILE
ncbi:MAG: hypothetical protein D6831_02065 [Aquificota bacterium]|nr:MAG: hypothetical protein D6831_02065 [Aquificota bacterium]